jgi:hypothetical protein
MTSRHLYIYISYRFEYLNYTIAGAPGDDDEKGAAVVFKYSKGAFVHSNILQTWVEDMQ